MCVGVCGRVGVGVAACVGVLGVSVWACGSGCGRVCGCVCAGVWCAGVEIKILTIIIIIIRLIIRFLCFLRFNFLGPVKS